MRKIAKLLVVFMVIGLLAACGSKDGNGNGTSGKDSNVLSLAVWGSSPTETNALEETVKSFEQKTGIDVKIEVIQDNFQDTLTARFAAKNAPDVFYLESYVAPRFIASGVLDDLSDKVNNQEDFYQPLLDGFRDKEGKLYGVPKDYSTLATYVNVDLIEKAGYSVKDIPTDWDGLLKFAKELQGKLDKGQAAMIFDATMARHLSAILATGLNPVKDNGYADFTSNKATLDYLQSIVDGQDEGYLLNPTIDLGIDSAGAAFGTGKAAIMIEGNWVLSALKQDYSNVKYDVLPVPTVNGKNQTMTFNVGYAVSKGSKNKENAVKFINYMTGEGQKQWSELSGTLPTRESVADELKLNDNKDLKAHVTGAEYGTVWASGETLPIISSSFDNHFQAALNGDVTVKEAMKAAEEEANAEIDRQK